MSVPELARSLAAVGFARRTVDGQEGLYILSIDEGNLVEKLYVGNDVESENIVASDIRENCSTPYLFHEGSNARLVFLIDQSDTLQLYTFDEESLEWEQSSMLSELAIQTSPESKLAASFTPTGETAICYQNTDGQLAGVISKTIPARDGSEGGKVEWLAIGPLKEASPKTGTPLRLDVLDDNLHLFYVHADTGGVHYFVLDPTAAKWEDRVLENSVFDNDAPIVNFLVTKSADNDDLLESYYLTSSGTIWNVLENKEDRKNLGKVDAEGNFKAADNAQAGYMVNFCSYNPCWQPPPPWQLGNCPNTGGFYNGGFSQNGFGNSSGIGNINGNYNTIGNINVFR